MNCEHLCTLCVQCSQVFTPAQIDNITKMEGIVSVIVTAVDIASLSTS